MPDKSRRSLKLVRDQYTLVYGLQLFTGHGTEGGPHAHVQVVAPDGSQHEMALHVITGSREEIREQLLQSIDAFFELIEPTPGGEP
jgi:hypothetical protein